jgi:hypothetical protein
MTTELRDYVIADGHLDDFVNAWRDGVLPLRERLGFRIEGAWTIPSQRRFVWILSHEAPALEWEAVNEAYYNNPERAALDPDPAQWIEEARQALVEVILPRARG